jgi:hypothetical protein
MPILVDLDELRASIRRAAAKVPVHQIPDEVARELERGRPAEDVRITDEDRRIADKAIARRKAKGR